MCFFSSSSAGSALLWAQVIQLQSAEDDNERTDHLGHAISWQEHWQLHCPSGMIIQYLTAQVSHVARSHQGQLLQTDKNGIIRTTGVIVVDSTEETAQS